MMRDLIEAAKAARNKAHAPYSKFYVGAAMRDESGQIHGGANMENAAYPQGWCAECSAISHLIMAGSKQIVEVVYAMWRVPPKDSRICER
jgi:cytidine deaminase